MLRDRREQNAMTGTQPGHTQAKGAKKQGTGAAWQMDMCSGSVLGKMLLFALPLMCSGILQLLFNAADIIVVGRFAGDNSLAAVGSNTALLCVIVVGLTLGNGVVFLGRGLLSLYTGSEMVVEAGLKRMAVVCRTYVLCGMMEVVVGSLRGLGHSVLPMIVSLIGACGLRLLWIFTFFRLEAFHTTTSLYLTYPVSWILTVTAHLICFAVIRRKMEKVWGSRTE